MENPFLKEVLASSGTRMAQDLRQRLVPHPGELGTEREEIIRRFLRSYLPKKVRGSTGFVFDATGQISKQLDIIIADALVGSRFETVGGKMFYPCQSVVAVGQVRSSLTSADAFSGALDNLESVKILDRSSDGQAVDTTYNEAIDNRTNYLHQIFTFLFVTGPVLVVRSSPDPWPPHQMLRKEA